MTDLSSDLSSSATSRKRLLLVTRNYPPLIGGMEKFNGRMLDQLTQDFSTALCGPMGCEEFLPCPMPVRSVPVKPLARFVVEMTWAAVRMAVRFRPHVIIAGSGLTAPMALLAARRIGVPVLVFLYGLDLVVSNRLYQRLWLPAIRLCDGFLAISSHTRILAQSKGLDLTRLRIVHPGVDIPKRDPAAVARFRENYGIGARPILLSVGRLTQRKGLVEFIEKCLPQIIRSIPDALLVVIGGEAIDALAGRSGGVEARAQTAAARLGISGNVLLLGRCPDETVQSAYQASQVHVFPVLDIPGDVEGFGMVALEAAINGIPTVTFAVGGIPDAVGEGRSGVIIAPRDYSTMAHSVVRLLHPSARDRVAGNACIEFAEKFEWGRIGTELRRHVSELADL